MYCWPEKRINQADNEGTTPLSMACQFGYMKVVNVLLIRKEIQINQPDNEGGLTPLFAASVNGHVNVVTALLARTEINQST